MFIEEYVEMLINAKNKDWYQSKGYKCDTKRINVNSKDLSIGCYKLIKYKCDRCGEIKELKFSSFIKHQSVNSKTFCVTCANKNINENKLNDKKYFLENSGYKVCSCCKRKLPSNTDYYFKKCDTLDGWTNKCKECLNKKFTDYLTRIPKEGYKFCIKCNKELPIDIIYFPPDKDCKDGLRNVCRCCGKDGHYMESDYIKRELWSKEEIDLLIKIYKRYTNNELVEKFFPNRTKRSLESQASLLGISYKDEDTIKRMIDRRSKLISQKLKGRKISEETKLKLSLKAIERYKHQIPYWKGKKRSEKQRHEMSLRKKGEWAGVNNPRYTNPLRGSKNGNWRGGITNFYFELRSELKDWRQSSMSFCKYKCVFTGDVFDEVHHTEPFKRIVDTAFSNLNMEVREKVYDYENNDFERLKLEIDRLHSIYGFGACLNSDIHKLFHITYGYKNFNKKDFIDFYNRVQNGEFNDYLKQHNIILNINEEYFEYLHKL